MCGLLVILRGSGGRRLQPNTRSDRARQGGSAPPRRDDGVALRRAGTKIVVGSDTGQSRFFIGWMGQLEFENWVTMGLTPAEAIVAATRDSAAAVGLNTGLIAHAQDRHRRHPSPTAGSCTRMGRPIPSHSGAHHADAHLTIGPRHSPDAVVFTS